MRLLLSICLVLLTCCSDSKDNDGLSVKLAFEVVSLDTTSEFPVGLAMTARIANHTGRDIFFYRPELQVWSYSGDEPLMFRSESPIDELLGVVKWDEVLVDPDTVNDPRFQLADFLIKRNPENAGENNIQKLVFAGNILFLKNGEHRHLTEGLTYLHSFPEQWKLVASSKTIREMNDILGTPPDVFNGYEFYTKRIVSDTLDLVIR